VSELLRQLIRDAGQEAKGHFGIVGYLNFALTVFISVQGLLSIIDKFEDNVLCAVGLLTALKNLVLLSIFLFVLGLFFLFFLYASVWIAKQTT